MASFSYDRIMDCVTDLDVLLIGKTGNGKSAVGNTILRQESFVASSDTSSETQDLKWAVGEFKRTKIKVVDGPGVGDTRLDTNGRVKQMHEWINKAIMMNDRGYHAFLLVLRFGVRYIDEEKDALRFLKQTFGEDFVSNHCVVVMTCGDFFAVESKRSGKTFDQWCAGQRGGFHELVEECGGRIVLFDNNAEGEAMDGQIEKLVAVIRTLGGLRYTNELFERAARLRVKAQVEARKPFLQGEVMEEISLITQALNREITSFHSGDVTYESRLVELSTRCESLIQRVIHNDRSTSVLKDLEARVVDVKQSIDSTIGVQTRLKEDREKMQKEMEDMRRTFSQNQKALEVKLQQEAAARAEAERRTSEVERAVHQEREHRQRELDQVKSDFEKNQVKLEAKLKEEQDSRTKAETDVGKLTLAFDDLKIKTERLEKTSKDQAEKSSTWDKAVNVMNGVATILSALAPMLGHVAPMVEAVGKVKAKKV